MRKLARRSFEWLDERYELQPLIDFAKKKGVPMHRGSVWYYFGGVSMFLFVVQVISGILLLLYYRTGSEQAYESVQFIVTKVRFGWLVRSVHSWSANLMVLSLFIHMFSVFFERAYRKPREMTWMTGVALLGLAMFFGFSGYLLPWNELSFFATKVGTDIVGVLPFVGEFLLKLLRGGEDVTGATLSRFYGIHVAVLPMITTGIITLHLLFVQRQGMSEPIGVSSENGLKQMPFFPHFVLRDLLLWVVVLNVLAFLAVYFPWELGAKADPFASAPAGIRPEWYFMFMFQTLKMLPAKVLFIEGELLGILSFSLGGLLWLMVPWLDRGAARGERSRWITWAGVLVLAFIIVMTVIGYSVD